MAKTEDLKRTVLRLPHELYDAIAMRAAEERTAVNTMLVNYIERGLKDEQLQSDLDQMAIEQMIEEDYEIPDEEEILALVSRNLDDAERGRIAKRVLLEGLVKAVDDVQMGKIFDLLVFAINEYNHSAKRKEKE